MAQTVVEKMKGTNNNKGGNNQTTNATKEVIELAYKDQEEFIGQSHTKMTTTRELTKVVNALFRVLPDYEGCNIMPDQAGNLQCSLFFHLSPGNMERAIVQSAESMIANEGASAKYQRMSMRSQNRRLYLTDFGKELLFGYIFKQPNMVDPHKFNWNQITIEQIDQQAYGQGVPMLRVSHINLLKIIPKFYSNPQKRYYQWNIQLVKPANGRYGTGGKLENYVINITRLDTKEVENLAAEMGFLATTGSLPIVRD